MVKNEEVLPNIFTQIGLNCLHQHNLAHNFNEIIKFIDEVVIKGIDIKREERREFADKYLKINYPQASNKILEHIKQALELNKCVE